MTTQCRVFRAAVLSIGLWGVLAVPVHAETKALPQRQGGWVFLDEDLSRALETEPEHHFREARDFILRKDLPGAARALRTAAAIIRLEAARDPEDAAAEVRGIAVSVRALAKDVGDGTSSLPELAVAAARAHGTLASHHLARVAAAIKSGQPRSAAIDLEAAADQLTDGLTWRGPTSRVDTTAAQTAHRVAVALEEGKTVQASELEAATKELATAVAAFNSAPH
ncbi:MAG: hypothetical protein HZB55_09355 [Deltaproteobacteria bacterium]|nr:hypothetical protein [Deltaproteobacteria bacterium]